MVIASRERSIRVLAPAGSGKTETLARRIRARIEEGTPPQRILVLTFDRNANAAFTSTLARLNVARRPEVRTLNAFGLKVLREYFPDERADVRQRFYPAERPLLKSLVDETDHAALMNLFSVLKSHLFDPRSFDRASLIAWIETHYERLLPQKFVDTYPRKRFGSRFGGELAGEFGRYEEFLAEQQTIDFDDQKLRAWVRLSTDPEVAARIRSGYDEIIVDEFQDINQLDVALVQLIASDSTLVVTGDDDQAIYGFRWASPTFLIQPESVFERSFRSYELGINYRCPSVILHHAVALIGCNKDRVPKSPTSGATDVGSIEHIAKSDRIAEANAIRLRIAELLGEDSSLTYNDIGVLYRRNEQHYPVQVQLFRSGIPFRVADQFDMRLQWRVALDLLDLSTALRAASGTLGPDLRPAVRAFRGFRYVPDAKRANILRFATSEGPLQLDSLIAAAKEAAGDYQGRMFETAIQELRTARSIAAELDVIESEFVGATRSRSAKKGKDKATSDDDSALGVLKDVLGSRPTNRAGSIERLRAFLESGCAQRAGTEGAVELSTCHGAKGRQWKIVVLPSVNEGVVPDPLTRNDHREEEAERRLFYVAMTRAARHLIIGHSETSREPAPSRFLYEAQIEGLPPRVVSSSQATAPPARAGQRATAQRKPASGPLARKSAVATSTAPKRSTAGNSRGAFAQRKPKSSAQYGTVRVIAISGRTVDLDPTDHEAVTAIVAHAGSSALGVHYRSSVLTFPLQFGLMTADVPFLIAPGDRLVAVAEMRQLYALLVGEDSTTISPSTGNVRPGATSGAMVASMARHARSQATTRNALKLLLDLAIKRASRPLPGALERRVIFRKIGTAD